MMYEELVKRLRYDTELLSQDGWAAGLFTEAADAIEELSHEIDIDNAAMTAMDAAMPRWIPVTERLPENYTDVLIYYERNAWPDGADYPVRKREIGIGFCGGPDRWHVDHCSGVDGLAWMPLPEPPKEEE